METPRWHFKPKYYTGSTVSTKNSTRSSVLFLIYRSYREAGQSAHSLLSRRCGVRRQHEDFAAFSPADRYPVGSVQRAGNAFTGESGVPASDSLLRSRCRGSEERG